MVFRSSHYHWLWIVVDFSVSKLANTYSTKFNMHCSFFYSFRISANCYFRSYSKKKVQNTTTDYQTNFDAFFMRFLAYDVRVCILRAKEQKSTKIFINKIPSLLLKVKYVWDGVVSCCSLPWMISMCQKLGLKTMTNGWWRQDGRWFLDGSNDFLCIVDEHISLFYHTRVFGVLFFLISFFYSFKWKLTWAGFL